MKTIFLGDIHGKFDVISKYIKRCKITDANIIQVGDFGVFDTFESDKKELSVIHPRLVKNNVFLWIMRGNHDFPDYFENDPFGFSNIKLIPDYTVLNFDKNILCIGGAVSVDRTSRYTKHQLIGDFKTKTGKEQWWPNEEFILNIEILENIRNIDIIVTHTCPGYCSPKINLGHGKFVEDIIKKNNIPQLGLDLIEERKKLDKAFTILKKNNNITNHYYGHFHKSACEDIFMDGKWTKHRVLNINELFEELEYEK